jgi:hypothetical protein
LPDLSDANGWDQPQYYSTILCADLNNDGQAEIIARGPDGILIWEYSADTGAFNPLPNGPVWSDNPINGVGGGWNNPAYYSTIQICWLGGQGNPALLGRGPNGVEAWLFDNNTWFQLPANQILLAADGWDQAEYYSTIQLADIDDDGATELIARGPQGLQAWKYDDDQTSPTFQQWNQLPNGPAWSDANGWNQVQYYSTIQAAYTLQSGDPGYSGLEGGSGQAVVLARNNLYLETWAYNQSTQTWSQTSQSAYPAFTGDQFTAYNYITTALNIQGTQGIGIRARYNDETGVLQGWAADLEGSGNNPVSPPSGISSDDWKAVKTQILNELTWVNDINYWYSTLTHQQIDDTFLGEDLTLTTIGPYLDFDSPQDNTPLVLSILGLIAGALAAALGFPELEAGAAASIVGVISYTFSAAELALPGQGGVFQADYSQLQSQLADGFNAALTQLGMLPSAITGGLNGITYAPGDYGLLSAIGQMIESTVWNWPSDTTDVTAAMQRGYAIEVWKVLFQARQNKTTLSQPNGQWAQNVYNGNPGEQPTWYPDQNALWKGYDSAYQKDMWHWLTAGLQNPASGERDPPLTTTLNAQFDSPIAGQVFPLGVSTADFYQGQNGWPTLWRFNLGDTATRQVIAPYKLPELGVDIHTVVRLRREPSGEILATVEITDRGLTGATNVEITDARLNLRNPVRWPPSRHTRLAPGRRHVREIAFPDLPRGARAVLRLSGRYLGGTFGASFRVTLP